MSYATQADLVERFGEQELIQLTDRERTGQINAAVLTEALEDADDLINGLLEARYAVPFNPVPALIRQLALPMARWNLYKDSAPEKVQKAYDAALRTLTMLATGDIKIGAGGESLNPAGAPQHSTSETVFSRDTLGSY